MAGAATRRNVHRMAEGTGCGKGGAREVLNALGYTRDSQFASRAWMLRLCVCVCVYLPSIGRCAPGTAIAAGPCRGTMRTSCRRSRAPVLRCSVYPSHPSGALQPAEAELQLRNSLRATAPCTRRGGRRLDCCHLAIQARTRRQRARVPRELRRVPPFRGRPIAASAGTSGTRRCAGAIA